MKLCAIVPSRNHYRAIDGIIAVLRDAGLPVLVIDDGSASPAREMIASLHDPAGGVTVRRLAAGRGKGGAVMEGFRLAHETGFSHALQVDADGQHDLDALPQFFDALQRYPDAVICGRPLYDASIPLGRRVGHWITDVWVAIETLSCRVAGSMCGFRIYPLAAVRPVLESEPVGEGMDFDIEILVRSFWRGTPVHMIPVRVTYPPGNSSNFRMLADNWRITRMHTRLVFGMLGRVSGILPRQPPVRGPTSKHWAALRERGAYWGLRFCAVTYCLLGRRGCIVLLLPVVAYFYLVQSGGEQRRASRAFLARALGRPPSLREGFRHYLSFATRTLDGFIAWVGGGARYPLVVSNPRILEQVKADPRGALMVVAHLGNLELARALLDDRSRARLTLLVHTGHAPNFNRVLREFRPAASANMVQVTEIGPATAIDLKERVERGEWVVIAGDRTPVGSDGRVSMVPFLGIDAPFSDGPWILGFLLECPTYLLFCLRDGDHHDLTLEPFSERITLPRGARREALRLHAARYASRLEHYVRRQPYQWFNFFDFWAR